MQYLFLCILSLQSTYIFGHIKHVLLYYDLSTEYYSKKEKENALSVYLRNLKKKKKNVYLRNLKKKKKKV